MTFEFPDKNIIQVTDDKSTVDIFWDTTDTPETAAFVHKNNMKILAMCIIVELMS